MESIKCVETQNGGSINKLYKVTYYENKLNILYDFINISSID